MNKEVKKIFLVLFFFALSGGVYYNFQELWMADNNLSTQTIGIVYSLCALLTVSTIFLCSNLIDRKKLKKFTCTLILLKALIIFMLFLLNDTGLNPLIKFLIMADYVIDTEIYACIYPMISYITKSDKIYAMRSLIYSYAYYGGILLTSLLLGKTILWLDINFNIYCLVGSILMIISFVILKGTNLEKYYKKVKEEENKSEALYRVLKKVKGDKITKNYLLHTFFCDIAFEAVNGLILTSLVFLGFSASGASNFNLGLGIAAVFVGTLILEKLTLKNNYINIFIKYGGRFILCLLAFLLNNKIWFLVAIIYIMLFSESYGHIVSAPYVNRFASADQLAFCNLKEMTTYLAKSIGNLICGLALTIGMRYNFLLAFILFLLTTIFSFKAQKLLDFERTGVNYDRK